MTRTETDRRYWAAVLGAGGFTALPRWTAAPVPGCGEHVVTVADEIAAALHGIAGELELPLGSIALAAHARVLAALSGEPDIVTGFVTMAGEPPVPCRLTTDTGSWLSLLADTHRVVTELSAHAPYPGVALERELGVVEQPFETIFDPTGGAADPTAPTVLSVGLLPRDGQLAIAMRYRTDVFDAAAAARIVGYHLAALSLIAAGANADPARQSLLSTGERRFLIEGLCGPHRTLPEKRFHELFEDQVRIRPDDIAAVLGDRQLTYERLNARANELARAMLIRGLGREDVVAVVMERNLDWMAAVIAILKAGGVYLPIEPHFPPERIAAMLTRSACKLALTELGSTTTLDKALASLPEVRTLFVDAALEEGHPADDVGIEVAPSQLAYIYFTSGSTGEPKGAMCEHAGMLNHLYAKIQDLEIGEGQVVAQVAPQCFDISLWQLVAALLVGGRTLLIDQDTILDVERFVDTIVAGEVSVVQVVPSYLEVVLSYLDQHPRNMPDLRYVSVTGEALTKELAERWFAAMPGVGLVNAYGLTETSDDTNHEVMDRPPDGDRVPLGRAIHNVYVYVVDEHLAPVPLGAPGEIVFSGICVGRGYINDPERTRLAYMNDPLRPGQRLYRSGDYGRWRPDGKLEYLGRRDAQVKIRGFRIEIGDVEQALLRVPGVRNGAVVVCEGADRSKHLVAFYSGERHMGAERLQQQLSETLPAYMVPAAFHMQEALPLTGNGKIDRKALRAIAAQLDTSEGDVRPPQTATEHRLAAAWADVLGVPVARIGRDDDFFDRGGTSLSAVRLAIALDRAVSLKDITGFPVLADLAALVDGRTQRHAGLLQQLSHEGDPERDLLVCFPYAGGNAVNFQPMAGVLAYHGVDVHAVELPGHDLAAETEPFAGLADVVDRVVAEITDLGRRRVLLWGQSSGAALAIATARMLTERGANVHRVFLGAQLLAAAVDHRRAIAEVNTRSNAEIAAELSGEGGYADVADLDPQRTDHIGAAFKHDFGSANEYLAATLDNPPLEKLPVPVTVVVAADDPSTGVLQDDHAGWERLAEHVDLYLLDEGGHYFPRTRPAETAAAVLCGIESPSRPLAANL